MIKLKREQFRVQIRQQAHQNIFKQKRMLIASSSNEFNSFPQLIDSIINPKIITQSHLKDFNSCLLNLIQNKNIQNDQLQELENNIDNFLNILIYQIGVKQEFIQEILTILINLTFISDKVAEKLLLNTFSQIDLMQLIHSFLQHGIELPTIFQLLVNLLGNSNCHKKEQIDILIDLDSNIDQSLSNNDKDGFLCLINKCLKNFINSVVDEFFMFDSNFFVKMVKKILLFGQINKVDYLSDVLETYCSIVQLFNFNFVENDISIIVDLINQSYNQTQMIEQICRVCSYFCINEPDEFYKHLLEIIINFCKQIFKMALNEQIPHVLNLCSIIFHQQRNTNYSFLDPFYEDLIILKDIIRFSEDCNTRKMRQASIRCIKILSEYSNELQIQILIELDIYNILMELLKDNTLEQCSILCILQSLNIILASFSVQAFQVDYPDHIMRFALSKNQEISKEANEILSIFENDYHNIYQ